MFKNKEELNNLEKSSITAVHLAQGRYSRLLNIDRPECMTVPRQKTKSNNHINRIILIIFVLLPIPTRI
jgi:hypothetical protein